VPRLSVPSSLSVSSDGFRCRDVDIIFIGIDGDIGDYSLDIDIKLVMVTLSLSSSNVLPSSASAMMTLLPDFWKITSSAVIPSPNFRVSLPAL